MATATAQAPRPDKRRGATTTARPLTQYLNNDTDTDSATILRLQRLRPFGVAGRHAVLLASLIWSDGGNDCLGGAA